jgi:hypothetical protein
LWNPDKHIDSKSLPAAGKIFAGLSNDRIGGPEYDPARPERAGKTVRYARPP